MFGCVLNTPRKKYWISSTSSITWTMYYKWRTVSKLESKSTKITWRNKRADSLGSDEYLRTANQLRKKRNTLWKSRRGALQKTWLIWSFLQVGSFCLEWQLSLVFDRGSGWKKMWGYWYLLIFNVKLHEVFSYRKSFNIL